MREERLVWDFAVRYGDPQHSVDHLKRVSWAARKIRQIEGGDWSIIYPACWLHDIARGQGAPEDHEKIGAEMARKFLENIGFDKERIEAICRVIAIHDTHGAQVSIEEKIVYDADRLDCFGSIGHQRCVICARKVHKRPEDRKKMVDDYVRTAFANLNTATAIKIAEGPYRQTLELLEKWPGG